MNPPQNEQGPDADAREISIPERFHDLLSSAAVAVVATIGRHGEPQQSPIWFLWDGERVRFSLVDGRQKLLNLRRDPRVAVTIMDPARPTRYVELRGEVGELTVDPEFALERAVAIKYAGQWQDTTPSGTLRFAAYVIPRRITSQG